MRSRYRIDYKDGKYFIQRLEQIQAYNGMLGRIDTIDAWRILESYEDKQIATMKLSDYQIQELDDKSAYQRDSSREWTSTTSLSSDWIEWI